jgi:hypothetical protein
LAKSSLGKFVLHILILNICNKPRSGSPVAPTVPLAESHLFGAFPSQDSHAVADTPTMCGGLAFLGNADLGLKPIVTDYPALIAHQLAPDLAQYVFPWVGFTALLLLLGSDTPQVPGEYD